MIGRTAEKVYNHKFRLRHINTGRLCTVQRIMYNDKKLVTLGLAEHLHLEMNPNPLKSGDNYRIQESTEKIRDLEESTLFQFISTNAENDARIQNLSCVKVQHCQSSKFFFLNLNFSYRVILNYEEKSALQCDEAPSRAYE